MNRMYPQVLFPAFRMQSNMMMYTLGTNFWMNRRNQLEKVSQHGCLTSIQATTASLTRHVPPAPDPFHPLGTCRNAWQW